MRQGLSALVLFSMIAIASSALAESKAAKKTDDGKRRDPKGIKGISPFWEALNRGDSAYSARDFDGAIAAYREAITAEPQNALGHYRAGEAQIAKGDLKEADAAFAAGLRFVGNDSMLKAKLEFAVADLAERQKAYDDATQKWTEYETFTTAQPDAKGYPASATERKKVIEAWKKLSADAAEVKVRIDKRLKEADDSVRKSSK
ncbi:MAG TPA: tetratricopeptide repeat protein [Polyangiaceae bacterium]|jgi:tetratricopeptide (TPR) repeat protein|nr:tetratricopeptide repeat protein [Polyangiaceae bacterium]